MKPLNNLIAIEIKRAEEKRTAGGIVLPRDKWGEKENIAIIKDLGGSHPSLKVEDQVLINPYAVLDTPDENIKLIKYEDILALWPSL